MDVVGLAKDFEDLSDALGLPDAVGGDYDGVARVAGMDGGDRALHLTSFRLAIQASASRPRSLSFALVADP